MSRPIVVTGAAFGIGAATAALLRERGEMVLGVDLAGSDICADLATEAGRQAMFDAVRTLAPDGITGIAAIAGTAKLDRPADIISTNYFGAVATLELLRPLLADAKRPRAVLVSSSAVLLSTDRSIIDACFANDEPGARDAAVAEPMNAYASSKRALALWMRRAAIGADWAGSGIPLNAVAPGVVKTPMTQYLLETDEGRAILRASNPIAVADYGEPHDLAEILAFFLTVESGYLIGQLVFMDGGTDAVMRTETI